MTLEATEPVAAGSTTGRPVGAGTWDLADLTTLRVGGPVGHLERTSGPLELADAVRTADREQVPVLVLGGGSNVLAADAGFPGVVALDHSSRIETVDSSDCGGTTVRVSAGTTWDDLVQESISNEWTGIEALSGIPGTVGAAPIQNIGAYGQEVAERVSAVRALDRQTGQVVFLPRADLHLGYRDSIMKRSLSDPAAGGGAIWGPTGRWVVLEVEFQFPAASLSSPVRYRELARTLGVEIGGRAPASDVRAAVLDLRRGKGMLLDAAGGQSAEVRPDHDTWSAGSFFTNPILTEQQAEALPENAPRFPVEDRSLAAAISGRAPTVPGRIKTSAAWLINNAGFEKGFRVRPDAPASLSTKHVLALTNRGEAKAADILELAATVRAGVTEHFGVTLVPEPVFVGCEL